MRPPTREGLTALAVTAIALALYSATLLPEVDWSDPAELALQAHQLGVTHPPGYPVHTFLGKLFMIFFGHSARATNFLSAVCCGLAAGFLTVIAHRLTDNAYASLAAGALFAALSPLWDVAVVTEVYGVNILLVALALLGILSWRQRKSTTLLTLTAIVFGLSLGSYLANLLLLPSFLFLLLEKRRDSRQLAAFVSIVALVGSLVLSWSFFRSQAIPPLGTRYVPDSPRRFLLFLTGAQYGTTRIRPLQFYLDRALEHMSIFCRAFLFAGVVLGLVGLWENWRRNRSTCTGLLLIFLINFGYFTTYAATDYYVMALPSYLVFSLWIAWGIDFLWRQRLKTAEGSRKWITALLLASGAGSVLLGLTADVFGIGQAGFGRVQILLMLGGCVLAAGGFLLSRAPTLVEGLLSHAGAIGAALLSMILIAGLIHTQLRPRLQRSRSTPVTSFVHASFELFPQDAVVIASWDKFAPLLYIQRTEGLREDLVIVERTLGPEPRQRTYRFGTVPDWRNYAREQTTQRPVFLDTAEEPLGEGYELRATYHGWYGVIATTP